MVYSRRAECMIEEDLSSDCGQSVTRSVLYTAKKDKRQDTSTRFQSSMDPALYRAAHTKGRKSLKFIVQT